MKAGNPSRLASIFVAIQLAALIQISLAIVGPSVWKAQQSDARGRIAREGSAALMSYDRAIQAAGGHVTYWGAGIGLLIFVLATSGGLLHRAQNRVQ